VPGLREAIKKGAMYGDYIRCSVDEIPEAKEQLLEEMIDMIRELAKKDEFWEITSLLNVDGNVMVSYKISIPHMEANKCEIADWMPLPELPKGETNEN
jgi:hypothetical protein